MFLCIGDPERESSHRTTKLALWIYSNLVAQSDKEFNFEMIDIFLSQAPITSILNLCLKSYSIELQQEATWVMTNVLTLANPNQVLNLWQVSNIYEYVSSEDE